MTKAYIEMLQLIKNYFFITGFAVGTIIFELVKNNQVTIYLSLGSNQGERLENLLSACNELINLGKSFYYSSVYETESWGFDTEQKFLNMALCFETDLLPGELLKAIEAIESKLGRIRSSLKSGYESRVIDIDILFYGDMIINSTDLVVPHPLLHKRKFVLIPLVEIDEGIIHPVYKKSIPQLLSECEDTGDVVLKSKFAPHDL